MSKRLLYLISIFFLTGFAPIERSSEIISLIEKLGKANALKESISCSLTYNLYAGANNKKLMSALKGILIKNKENKYSQLGEIESLTTASYVISIDTKDKMIMLSNKNGKANQGFDFEQLKKYLALCKQYHIIPVDATQSKLSLELNTGEISKLDIFYTRTFLVQKVVLTYPATSNNTFEKANDESQQLEICFSETTKIIQGDPRLKISNYCTVKNGHWQPTIKYAGYQFINNLIQK